MKISTTQPLRRSELLVTQLEDETLVYDPVAHRAHCLSQASQRVFLRCDGRTAISALIVEMAAEVEGSTAPILTKQAVWQVLTELSRAGLLVEKIRPQVDLARRGFLGRAALPAAAAVALPMVWSIVAPTVADAASLPPVACAACQSAGQCCGPSGQQARTCLPNGGGGFACTGPSTGQCNSICR